MCKALKNRKFVKIALNNKENKEQKETKENKEQKETKENKEQKVTYLLKKNLNSYGLESTVLRKRNKEQTKEQKEFTKIYYEQRNKENKEQKETKANKDINIKSIMQVCNKQYLCSKHDYSNFDINKAFVIHDFLFENNNEYYVVLLNSEAKEFFNLKFLYFKDNHNLKYDKYSIYFDFYKNVSFNGFKVSYYVYSIVLHDIINTYIIFDKNTNFKFKYILAKVLKLDYHSLQRKNDKITKKEKDLIKSFDLYGLIGFKRIENKTKNKNVNKELHFIQNSMQTIEQRLDKLKHKEQKLIRIRIKNNCSYSKYELNIRINQIKQVRKSIEYNKALFETFSIKLLDLISFESLYEQEYFKNLLYQHKDTFIDYESFVYTEKEQRILNLK